MNPRPAQAYCKRCEELFVYFRHCARRFYCTPCVDLERRDHIEFNKLQRRKAAVARILEKRSAKQLVRYANGISEGVYA